MLLVLVLLATRLAFLGLGQLVLSLPETQGSRQGLPESLGVRWDSVWYLTIIREGYSMAEPREQPGATNFEFYPVYPMLARTVAVITGIAPVHAGLLVANGMLLLALILIYEYALKTGCTPDLALLSAILVALAPHSFVLSCVYSESTFLCLLAGAMLAHRNARYWTAGILAATLSATRAPGLFYAFFALAMVLRKHGWKEAWAFWRHPAEFIPLAMTPLGLFAFYWQGYGLTGDAFAQATSAYHGWNWLADWPWRNLPHYLAQGDAQTLFWVGISFVYAAALLLLVKYRLYEELALCSALLLLYWCGTIPYSLPRYCLMLFPVYIATARRAGSSSLAVATLCGLFACFNGLLIVAWTLRWVVSI